MGLTVEKRARVRAEVNGRNAPATVRVRPRKVSAWVGVKTLWLNRIGPPAGTALSYWSSKKTTASITRITGICGAPLCRERVVRGRLEVAPVRRQQRKVICMRTLVHALKLDLEDVQRLDAEACGDNAYPYMIFRQLLDVTGELFQVCKNSEGNVIAYGVIAPSVRLGSGWLLSLVVSSQYRRKGIGTALVNQLLYKAASFSLDQVNLTVAPDNGAAISFYQRLGFTPAANVERHYFGRDSDRILMSRLSNA